MPIHRLIFSLLLIFLPTQLGYHFWPEWATVLGRRVDYLSPTPYFTDVLIFLTLFFWVIGSGKEFLISTFKFLIKRRNVQFLIFILFFIFANIFFASSRPVAIYKWLKVLEFVLLGFYIIKTKPTFSFIIHHVSFGIFFSSLLAIAQFILQHSVGGPLWWLGERTFTADTPGIARMEDCRWTDVSSCMTLLRPYATFPHPNALGGFLAMLLPLLLVWIIMKKDEVRWKKYIIGISFGLGIVALGLSFSRSAWLVGSIGLIAAPFFVNRKKLSSVFFGPGFPLPQLLFVAFIAGLFFIGKSFQIGDESIVVRQQLNAAAIKLWQQSPIVGVGLGNFLIQLPNALPSRTIYFLQPVHNIYLLVLAETGVVGLALFLWLLSKSIRGLVLGIREKKKQFLISHFSFFILLLLGLVDHYPLTLQQGQLLFTILLSVTILP